MVDRPPLHKQGYTRPGGEKKGARDGKPDTRANEAEYLNGVRSGNVRKKGLRNRNRRIRRDRTSGMSYIDLGAKYELSRAILHQIINRC